MRTSLLASIGAILLTTSILGGCGGGVSVSTNGPSCSGTKSGIAFCTDLVGGTAAQTPQFQTACTTTLAGTFAPGPCSRQNAIGGCEASANGVEEVTWIYSDSGATTDQVTAGCAQANQTFVSP